MSPKNKLTSGPGVQIVELTMDNPEDQDELNRRLRKPGEADSIKSKTLNDTATHASNGAEQGRCT
jgi:hypothetical protein